MSHRYPTRYQNRILQQLLGVNVAPEYDQIALGNDDNSPFGYVETRLDGVAPAGFDAVPIFVVAVELNVNENDDHDFQEDIVPWIFDHAYDWILNRENRGRDAMDYAQIRLLRPPGAGVFMWDITSDFYPTTDVVQNFLTAYDTALQSNDRNGGNLETAYDGQFQFFITFVLTNYVTSNRTRNRTITTSVPSINRDNLGDIVNFSRTFATPDGRMQSGLTDLNRRKQANRWLSQNRTISGRVRPLVIKRRRTNEEVRADRENRAMAAADRDARPPPAAKRTYKKRRTAQQMTQLRNAIQAAEGVDISNTTLTSNVSKFQLGGEGLTRANNWTDEQRQRYNAARRAKRNAEIRGIYEDTKKKLFHHSSLDTFYKHSKAVLHVPNSWDEGYCIAMAFMKSECRFYKRDGSVSESEPHLYQPDEGRYAHCPIMEPFSHLIDQDCDFITGDHIILFNPYKYPSVEPDPFLKYAYQPPPDIVQKWYQAAQNMHLYVESEIGMQLDPNSEATMQAYCEVFEVYLSVYNIETKVKRSIVLSPLEVDLRNEEEFKVVSVLVSKHHCSAITNLRAFLKTTMSANRASIHNYCVFCQKMWTSNNQTREEAKAHFQECIETKKGSLSCNNFSKDRDKVIREVHPEQFTYDRKRQVHICNLCKCEMDQGMQLGQIHHVCYMKKDGKLKMGEEKDVYVFDFECEQKRQFHSKTFVHKVNLVCVRSVYPNAEGEIDRHLFHTLDEFVAYVMSHSTSQRVYLAHNGSKYDTQFVVRYLEANMIPFDFIPAPSSMHAYLRVSIRFGANASATFLDFRHFMPGSLKSIGQSLNLVSQKGDFPHHFNNGFNEHYEGRLPILNHPDDFWCLRSKKTEEELTEFAEWFREQESVYCTCDDGCVCAKKQWSFQEEIIKYCWIDVDVLAEAARNYRDWLVTLGEGEDPVEGWTAKALDPFQYLTIPQLAMTVLMSGLPEEENVTITPYKKRRERVPLAIAWMERLQPSMEYKIRHVANWRQEFFEPTTRRFIDGVTDDMHIFICLNCEFHGCSLCYHEEFNTGKDHPTRPGTFGRIAHDTERFLRHVFKTYGIEKTHVVWQHELTLTDFSEYEKELGKVIIDREMFCGGRTEVFSPFCNADLYPDDEIQYHDVCSLYPYVCAFTELPIGNPEHYCGRDIDPSRLLDCTSPERYYGYIRCHVVPNQSDVLGLLPFHEPKTGRLEFPLFPMTGTWGTEELRLAMDNGYIVEEIYEVYHWPPAERSNTFMRGFVSYFLRLKQEAEGWKKQGATSEEPSEEEKDYIIEKVFEENGNISRMRSEKVKKNAVNRQFAKIYLNSLWGKFCQKAHTDNYTTIHGYHEFAALWNDPHLDRRKMQFRHLSAGTWKVKYHAHEEFAQTNAKYNIFLAAWVTQTARCVLHQRMLRIGSERILYCDTDSIMALLPKGAPDMTGHGLGNWVNEYPDTRIQRLTALAPKFYFLQFDGDEELLKSKGIMMSHENRRLLNGFTLGKQILELFYPRTNELQQQLPFQGFIGMKNMLIGINATSPHFDYGTMLTRETEDKKLQPVITKRHLVPFLASRNVTYDAATALSHIPRIYTLPKGYYRSVEEMSNTFY